MLDKIIRFSINHGLWIIVSVLVLVSAGIYTTSKMDIDVFPDLTAPTVVVMTPAPNMAAEEVERLISFHIETGVNGATNVRRVRSSSMPGYSFVWIEFDWGTDIFKARQIVSEKMISLSEVLPPNIQPELAPQSSVMGEILFIGLQADTTSMAELRSLAEWVVKPAILATGGVSQVSIIGGDLKQFQVLLDPLKMNAYDIDIEDVERALEAMCQNSSGGVLREFGNEYSIRGMSRSSNLEEIGESFVKLYKDKPICVADVAEVKIGSEIKMGHASKNAKPAVLLSVSKQPSINTIEVTKKIESNLNNLKASLPKDVVLDSEIFRQADFIEASVSNVGRALIEGAIFVIIIMFLFLRNYRTTVISVLAIPISLIGSLIILYLIGMNINTMTLGGMCIAIGSLVDDAIIDVENVYNRLRENALLPIEKREKISEIVFRASKEIRSSVINATFIIIVVFIPLFFLSGMEGRMLKPLGITYIVSLLMSLVVAMTITPLLCRYMLGGTAHKDKENKFVSALKAKYKTALLYCLNHKKTVIISTIALFSISLASYFTLGGGFLPEFNEGSLTISVVAQAGTSLDENNEIGNVVEKALLEIPEVKTTGRRTGRGELDEHSQAINSSEIEVIFKLKDRSKDEFLNELRESLSQIPGIAFTVGQPLGHRIDHMLSGTRANIAIKLFGSDLSRMFSIANQIKGEISDIDGLVDVSVEQQTLTPQWHIKPNRAALAKYGISLEDFNNFVSTAYAGKSVGKVFEQQRSYDLFMRYKEDYTNSIDGIKQAPISTAFGKKIPLEEVADFVSVGGANSISRENVQRKIVISANVAGRDLQSCVDDIKQRISQNISLPQAYSLEYGGQFESAQKASRTLFLASLISLLIVFLLLYVEFKNLSLAAIVLINLPLSLIGGVLAIKFSSGIVSIPSIIGFITLFGIATRNGILLISRYHHLEQEPGADQRDKREIILQGSVERLNPILMTAITTALALIPLVFNGDKSGNEIQSPMAFVVLGGLLSSSLLNIFLIPIVYEWFRKRKKFTPKFTAAPKMGLGLVLVFCFSALGLSSLEAQDKVQEKDIHQYKDIESVIEAVSSGENPRLKALEQTYKAQILSAKTEILPSNPSLEVSYLWGKTAEIGNRMDMEVMETIDFPSVYVNKKQLSKIQISNSELGLKQEKIDFFILLRKLCANLVHYNAVEKLWKEHFSKVEELYKSNKKRELSGEIGSIEMGQASLFFAKTKKDFSNVLVEKYASAKELAALVFKPHISLVQDSLPMPILPNDFEDWYRGFSKSNPELLLLQGSTQESKKAVSLSKSSSLPNISAGYKGEDLLGQGYNGLAVGISIPLWENANTIKMAKAQSMASELIYIAEEAAIKAKYEALFHRAKALKTSLDEYRTAIENSNIMLGLEKAFGSGEVSLIAYIAESELFFEMQIEHLELLRDYYHTCVDLRLVE